MQAVAGLSERELARVRGRLVEFAGELFESIPRRDQRRWGEVYVRGLMLDGKRKSIEPMAARLADGDEQCLQQFVSQSPWDEVAVRRALASRMSRELSPEAWVIDDTGFPKFGKMSVGVARQYSGALGKVGNCQVTVNCHYVERTLAWPVATRLDLGKAWATDAARAALAALHTTAKKLDPSTGNLLVALTTRQKPYRCEQPIAAVERIDDHDLVGEVQRHVNRFGEAAFDPAAHDQPIDSRCSSSWRRASMGS